MGTLYVIATPIGNLGDITFRAIETLQSVDAVLCEDTRVTKKLLDHYNIKKPLIRADAHMSERVITTVIERLQAGENIALVSDAGTPAISDPGVFLVQKVAEVLGAEVIVPIPGPSALTTALSAAGLPCHSFLFLGFLPHKKGRKTLFEMIKESEHLVVLYESPHRLEKTLESLAEIMPDRIIVLAKELTKIYETFIKGTPKEVLEYIHEHPRSEKGEFVVLVAPAVI